MITAFTSLTPAGATFMDWSWHWLKGSDSVWSSEKGWMPIVDSPNTTMNAHRHHKNHPIGIKEWKKFLESASEQSKDVSFYPIIRNTDDNDHEFVDNVNWLINQGIKVVVIKRTEKLPIGNGRTGNKQDHKLYLLANPDLPKDSTKKKLREIVSIRLMAQQKTWLDKIDIAFERLDDDVIIISDKDWTENTEREMLKIFDRLGVPVIPERLDHWRKVVEQWQEKYKQTKHFYYHEMPEIADKIVSGEDMDLEHLDLGFFDECMIMILLMKSHGKRLLLPDENFPKNTKDLHKFLK